MKIFGIVVEKKTDILAATAFLISLLSIIGQIAFFLKGPDVELFTPEQILVLASKNPDGEKYARIAAIMTYRNSGSPGYHDTIKKEYVTFKLQGNDYILVWDEFIDSYPDENDKTKLKIYRKSEAIPVHLNAGRVEAHETLFSPWVMRKHAERNSYLTWDNFIKAASKQEKIDFRFTFETFSGKVEYKKCHLLVKDFIKNLEKGWSAPITYY